jgi:2-octaprenyl-6-methoxyphenol hydroxylase
MLIDSPNKNYDIVIVGGGMVGASFACALSKVLAPSMSALVVEAFQQSSLEENSQPSFDSRSTALSYGSSKFLEKIGVWESLSKQVTPIKEIHVSDKGRFGSTKMNQEQQHTDALGYVFENRKLGSVLNAAMAASKSVSVLSPAVINHIKPDPGGMTLEVVKGQKSYTINAALVVLADGGRSPICGQLGIASDIEDYQQCAIISNIAFEKPHKHIAFERFTDTGPLAILPLESIEDEHRGALVWTINQSDADELMSTADKELLVKLQERFGNRLGRITRIGKRFSYPLSLSVAKEQIRPGLVLLGNVAHTLHPVGGQGLNLALRDTESLVSILAEAVRQNKPLGSMSVLQEYLDIQAHDQGKSIEFTHHLNRLFSSNNTAKVWLRKFGLFSIDFFPGLKQEFARQAMGLSDK